MTGNKEIESGLKAMARDFQLPGGGRKKLVRLIAEYLWWFEAAEERGMSWLDIIRALTSAGVTARGGKPLSVGTLSSTVWRKRTKGTSTASKRPSPQERHGVLPRRQPHRKQGVEAKHPPAGRLWQAEAAAPSPASGRSMTKAKGEGSRHQPNKEVLAFMNRARLVRRRCDET